MISLDSYTNPLKLRKTVFVSFSKQGSWQWRSGIACPQLSSPKWPKTFKLLSPEAPLTPWTYDSPKMLHIQSLMQSIKHHYVISIIQGTKHCYPEGGPGIPLQYSCLENPMDRGSWRAAVHGVAQNWTRLKQLSVHACKHPYVLHLKVKAW